MNVDYSKRFVKQAKKLDSPTKELLAEKLREVKQSKQVTDITNCIKMSGYKSVYRIRISDYRAIFIHQEDNLLFFEYIVSRGQVYDKRNKEQIKGK